jgi:DNA gyrase/topoisomerase IV subunit A
MATDKLFKVFGVSKLNGNYKVRFANDVMRIKVLTKHGHEDIILTELPTAVTKYEGVKTIKGMAEFASVHAQAAISEYLEDKAPKAAKAPKIDVKASKTAEPVAA